MQFSGERKCQHVVSVLIVTPSSLHPVLLSVTSSLSLPSLAVLSGPSHPNQFLPQVMTVPQG